MSKTNLDILGIRHHGPGSARMVLNALKKTKPDAVLIEGPPDAHEVLELAADKAMVPPVALLVYEPDKPASASYYPFAEFSPEWQAIRWAMANKAEVRFIDLPWANRVEPEEPASKPKSNDATPEANGGDSEEDDDSDEGDDEAVVTLAAANGDGADQDEDDDDPHRRRDPLEMLAQAAGYEDGEAWWGRLIEERSGSEDPHAVFAAILEAMREARAEEAARAAAANGKAGANGTKPHFREHDDNPEREAHMRRSIRGAMKEGFDNIAVVCGAYHAPVLTKESLDTFAAKADEQLLKGLPKRKTTATWIPWTYERLSMWSGYGAGVYSPGWYDHLWHHPDSVVERWMTRVARLLRDEDIDASSAHVIEAARLARTLASLRGRSIVGLPELNEATLSVICSANPLPLKIIERKLIVGIRLGETPEETPVVPLQRDLAALQKSLRMKVSADDVMLDLDQRKDMDLARSHLLHRLNILGIAWGQLQEDSRRTQGTFHEVWKLQWAPELAVSVVEAARWGNTVEEAAGACVLNKATMSNDLPELTRLLDDVLLADLPGSVEKVIARIQDVSAIGTDLGHLMDALPPLAGVLRYGNVRKTDAALVEPVVAGLLARICAGIGPACGSLDDDAAGAMNERVSAVDGALRTLDRADFLDPWRERLTKLGDAQVHGLVAGLCWRILLDAHAADSATAGQRLSLALSPGNDPAAASAWLEGFLSGSGLVLVHDTGLLSIIDAWVGTLPADMFERVCPIVRRTFATFPKPERRQIGQALKRSAGSDPDADGEGPAGGGYDGYNAQRGSLVDPVLRLILGEPL